MGKIGRILGLLLFSIGASLSLLLYLTYRNMGDPGPLEVRREFLRLTLVEKSVVARTTQQIFGALPADQTPMEKAIEEVLGTQPPLWAQKWAVVWESADVLFFWWLPLVLMGVIYLAGSFSRRRTDKSHFK